jgi:LytS/YehU family sensor histidine kinase
MGSGTDFILLENELEILDDYLKLQQLRFQGKFDYFFELSQEIDQQQCMVPPMLLQPFIENSIEHGVRDIDRQGTIIIRFNKNYNTLVIEVEDNGRGLNDQEVSNKKSGHISMATKITKQRMQNLQALTKQNCKFEILDNAEISGLSGVLVRIEISYQEDN